MAAPVPHAGTGTRAWFGIAGVLAAVLFWAMGGVLGASTNLSGLSVAFWRLWIGAFSAIALCALTGRRLRRADVVASAPGGVLFAVNVATYFSAVRHSSVAFAELVAALTPVVILPLAPRLFGERITTTKIVCALISVGGISVVVVAGADDGRITPFGAVLAVASLFTWAWYFIVTKQTRARVGTLEYLTAMTAVAAVAITPVAFVVARDFGTPSWSSLLRLALLAWIPGLLGHGCMTWAHPHVDASVSSVLTLGATVLAAVAAVIFLDETLTGVQVAGAAVVMASLTLLTLAGSKAPQSDPELLAA